MTVSYFGSTMGFSTYVPEIFPTSAKLRSAGIASVVGRAASIAALQAVGVLHAFNGVNGVIFTVMALGVAQAVILSVFGLATTKRSLDSEIADASDAPVGTTATVRHA